MAFLASFLALSVGGIITSGYLLWKHYQKQKQPLVCPLNHDCGIVTESKWSHLFYVRNEVLGLLFYIGMLAAGLGVAFLNNYTEFLLLAIKISTALGVLFSLFLVFIQVKVIKDYCFYCLISAVINVLLFINGLVL